MRRALVVLLTGAFAGCASRDAAAPGSSAAPPVAPPAAELARSGLLVVREGDATLRDETRRRDLAIHATYPDGKGPLPVIVFSPGAGGSGTSSQPLARFWATRGYAVLALTHGGASRKKGGGTDALALREPAADAVSDPKSWENRARDVVFVLDALSDVGTKIPELGGRIDAARIGVAGQSYGAFTAELLAGATVDTSRKDKSKSFADPRPRAFLLLSPPGKGQQGLTEKSWASVTRPLMVLTGSRDRGVKGQDPSWRLDAYRLSPPGNKYGVWIEGGSHLSYSGRAAEPGAVLPRGKGKDAVSAEREVATFQQVKIASLAFWDAYLRDDANARAFLDSDALTNESGGKAKLERR